MKKQYLKISFLSLTLLSVGCLPISCSNDKHESVATQHEEEDHDHGHEGHDHDGLIKLDRHRADEFGVRTERIDASDFAEVIQVSGQIESKATDEAIITATRSGILNLSSNINAGVRVSAGSPVGSVYSTTVQGGDPSVEAAAARDASKRELDRLAPLHKDGVVSTQVYNEALSNYEQAQAALKSARQGSASVSSPKTGVITRLLAKSGEYVEKGQKLAVVSGNTSLTLKAEVPEKYLRHVSNIISANFRPASSTEMFSLDSLNGKLISTPGSIIAENGYLPLYFSFDNYGEVTPGVFAEIYLIAGKRPNVISVPKEAIVEINGNKCVYTLHENGLYEKHVVSTGASDGSKIEILSGLNSGESVVVEGAQVVRMAETSATAVPGHTHNH